MAYKFIRDLVPTSMYKYKCPYTMIPDTITVHNTWNDATAQNEINYMSSNYNYVSYHYAIDDVAVVQGIPENRNAFHAGDGSGKGNRKSIGVEICYSKNGGSRYIKAEQNAVLFVAAKLKQYGWGTERLRKHQDWSGKYCPHRVLAEGRWASFVRRVQAELNRLNGSGSTSAAKPAPVTPTATPVSRPAASGPDYNTTSVVTFLDSIDEDSGFGTRAQLAAKYGIEKYSGTASQNSELLAELKDAHRNPEKQATGNEPNYKTESIVTFLVSAGEDSGFANRAKMAASFGISGYKGTASQNTQLLEKLKASYKNTLQPKGKFAGGDPRTGSIVDYLKSIEQSSSFANRSKIAKEVGISNYSGTASQNADLLDRMRSGGGGGTQGKPTPAKKPVNKYAGGNKSTESAVDYLKSIGQSSSFTNRAKIAKELGISGYKGTAAQNKQLLDKMRG